MLSIAVVINVALAAAAPEHYIFGAGRDWLIVDSSGAVVRRLTLAHEGLPESVQDAAISKDGKRLIVAAHSPELGNVMLYLWDLDKDSVTQVGEKQGFHAAPSFSADGKWLTFAHHATRGGPVGMHEARAYAQLYRQRLDGGAPEALTRSDGCHMESWSLRLWSEALLPSSSLPGALLGRGDGFVRELASKLLPVCRSLPFSRAHASAARVCSHDLAFGCKHSRVLVRL